MTIQELSKTIDHTNLNPEVVYDDIKNLCEEAEKYNFRAVCINPYYVNKSKKILSNNVRLVTVVGFPLGANTLDTKLHEAKQAIDDGADDIDAVIHVGKLRKGDIELVRDEISRIVDVCKEKNPSVIVKIILETAALCDHSIIDGCTCSVSGGADFIKSSTGKHPNGGATISTIKLMYNYVKNTNVKIKASGGIKSARMALKMISAGASVLGTSSGVNILKEYKETQEIVEEADKIINNVIGH